MLLEEMTEVQKPLVVYEDNQGAIFLANNRQVGMRTKHIDICHHFMRYMAEDKEIDIKYIMSEENPTEIMIKNCSEAYFVKPMNSIIEGELWGLMETGRKNVKITRVTDDIIRRENNEYSSHTLAKVVDGKKQK